MPAEESERAPEVAAARATMLLLFMAVAVVAIGPRLQGLSRGFGSLLSFALIFGALPIFSMGRSILRPASPGLGTGLVLLGALVGLANYGLAAALQAIPLSHLGLVAPDPVALFAGQPRHERIALALAICLAAPLFEEFAFRRALQPPFIARFSPCLGILLTALGYAAIHLDVAGFAARVEMGIAFGLAAHWSRSLWPAVAAHAVHNLIGLFCLAFAHAPGEAVRAPARAADGALAWLYAWALASLALTAFALWRLHRRASTSGARTAAAGKAPPRAARTDLDPSP